MMGSAKKSGASSADDRESSKRRHTGDRMPPTRGDSHSLEETTANSHVLEQPAESPQQHLSHGSGGAHGASAFEESGEKSPGDESNGDGHVEGHDAGGMSSVVQGVRYWDAMAKRYDREIYDSCNDGTCGHVAWKL